MDVLKYEKWSEAPPFSSKVPTQPRLQPFAKAFEDNMTRVRLLGHLPLSLVFLSGIRSHTMATIREQTKAEKGLLKPGVLESRVGEIIQEKLNDPKTKKDALESIGNQMELDPTHARTGMEALLSSIVILAFGAFENLTTDLWIESVNMRPRSLAIKVLNAGRPKPKSDEDTRANAAQEKMISFSDLATHQFNVSEKMGQLLRERKVVSFETFEGIKMAYEVTFLGDDGKSKCPKLQSILNNKVFHVVQLIRNLYAHKSGVVDQKFQERIRRHDESLSAIPIGQALTLDFEEVLEFATVLVTASNELLSYVDDWLTANPE
jgi:hypothetical protein